MATVEHEPARAGVTEIRVHGVGGTSPVSMLGRSDLVQVAGDEISGFYRSGGEPEGKRTVEAYSWGGLTARSATRALWTLLLPFSLINIAGWMIEPVRERVVTPGEGLFGVMDRALAGFGRRFRSASGRLRRAQEWLVHLLALVFTATYIQLTAYLSVDLFAFQCGSDAACRERLPLTGVFGGDLEVGRRLVIGSVLPLLLLLLFLFLARRSRLTYESFRPQVDELRPAGATPLEDARIWDRAKYQKIMARLHAVACLGVLTVTFAGSAGRLVTQSGWRTWLYGIGVAAGALFGLGSLILLAWIASRRDESTSQDEEDERRIYVTWNRVSSIGIWVVLVLFAAHLAATWPVRSAAPVEGVVTWFGLAPLWLLLCAIAVGFLISSLQAARWLFESYLHTDQFLVVIAAIVAAVFPYPPVFAVVALILLGLNVASPSAEGRFVAWLDLAILSFLALIGLMLSVILDEPTYLWFGVAISTVAAAFFWLARRPDPGFRWAGTGAVGAFAAVVLLGIFSGLIIRTASWLSTEGFTITYPDFYEWAVVVVTIGLVLVVIAMALHSVRVWLTNRGAWRSETRDRLDEAGYPEDAAKDVTSSSVLFRSLVEAVKGADVMITLAGMVMFSALVTQVVDIAFRGKGADDWFPDDEPAWTWLLDLSAWLALAAILGSYLAVRSAINSEATRRKIGMVWDVASFFPRSFHPLAPPAYAARAVPEIQARVRETVMRGGSVILAGHSQGSVISAAVMASLPEEITAKTALVTYGSPIGKFYRSYFPAAFPDDLVHGLAHKVGPRQGATDALFWVNFYRPTDPIAAPALRPGELAGLSVPELTAEALTTRKRAALACDVQLDDPWEERLLPYRPIPGVRGHSGYESDPAWSGSIRSLATLLTRAMPPEELVVLVDEADRDIGTAEKIAAHRDDRLHRAVSVFVFDARHRLLIQRRADSKHIFGGRWANTSCTHPRPDEEPAAAGRRRLREEMGIDADVVEVGTFIYRALDPETSLIEAELDHVLVGETAMHPTPNPVEVADHEWVEVPILRRRMTAEPDTFAPWLAPALDVLRDAGVISEYGGSED